MIVMNLTRKPILPSGAQDAHLVGILSPLSQAQLSIYLSCQGLGETDGSTTANMRLLFSIFRHKDKDFQPSQQHAGRGGHP